MGFFVARRVLRGLRFKSLALVEWIVQLGEGIRNLPPGDIQLEPIGQGRVGILSTGQRRNLDRIVGDERRLLQIRLHRLLKDLVENDMERRWRISLPDRETQSGSCFIGCQLILQDDVVKLIHLHNGLMIRPPSPRRREIDVRALIVDCRGPENVLGQAPARAPPSGR